MTLDNSVLPQVSVVVPVFNEQDNIAPLVHEITAALRGVALSRDLGVVHHPRRVLSRAAQAMLGLLEQEAVGISGG